MDVLLLIVIALPGLLALVCAYGVHREAVRLSKRMDARIDAPSVHLVELPQQQHVVLDSIASQPLVQLIDDHVWADTPFSEDATSQSFRCQIDGCERIRTVMR